MSTRKNDAQWMEKQQRWQIKVQKDGQRRTFYSSNPSRRGKVEAERKADHWLEVGSCDEHIKLKDLWAQYIDMLHETSHRSTYTQIETYGKNWIIPFLGQKKMSAIKAQGWQDCINAAAKAGKAQKTCKNIRAAITGFLKYAKRRGIPTDLDELTIPKIAVPGERKILQPDDLEVLFTQDTVTKHGEKQPCTFIHAWRFAVLVGLRPGELCGLKWDDIQGGVLTIKRSINSYKEVTPGKNKNAKRRIVLPPRAASVLLDQQGFLRAASIKSAYIFPDEQGDPANPRVLYDRWKFYRREHGLNCSPYELRHTAASMAQAEVPEALLKRVFGHSKSMDTYGVYGHEVDGELDLVAQKLEAAYDRILPKDKKSGL